MGYAFTEKEEAIIKRNKERELAEMNKERKKDRDLCNNSDFNKLPGITELLKTLRLPNVIETVEEEDFVIRSFLRHGTIAQIVRDLQKKHPDVHFRSKDVTEFIYEYQDAIKKQMEVKHKSAIRRIMKTKEGLTHELLDLAEFSKELAVKYDDADDHTSAISAIKAAADIFYRNAKIEGLLDDNSGTTININTQMDKLVDNVTNESSGFKDAIMKVVNNKKDVIDVEYEEIKDAKDRS